jgi:ribosomal protein L13E
MTKADAFITHADGPRAIVRSCKLCKHVDIVRKERSPGRGWGMREGNKQRGRLIQHIKECHPEALK